MFLMGYKPSNNSLMSEWTFLSRYMHYPLRNNDKKCRREPSPAMFKKVRKKFLDPSFNVYTKVDGVRPVTHPSSVEIRLVVFL